MQREKLKQMVLSFYQEGILFIPEGNNCRKWFIMRMEELIKELGTNDNQSTKEIPYVIPFKKKVLPIIPKKITSVPKEKWDTFFKDVELDEKDD